VRMLGGWVGWLRGCVCDIYLLGIFASLAIIVISFHLRMKEGVNGTNAKSTIFGNYSPMMCTH
jgi:hypothetical protein